MVYSPAHVYIRRRRSDGVLSSKISKGSGEALKPEIKAAVVYDFLEKVQVYSEKMIDEKMEEAEKEKRERSGGDAETGSLDSISSV
ncbi:MAG: hypothetical protein MPW15_21625 [Candidatus Manganitrophus sp.]|nr:hypothetical protein [Candidatus Manganitrophus sp.]